MGEWRRELREAECGSSDEDRGFLDEISPVNTIDRIEVPLFVLRGANDPRVPVSEAHQIVEEARDRVLSSANSSFEDEGHDFSKLDNQIEAYRAIVDFLDVHV